MPKLLRTEALLLLPVDHLKQFQIVDPFQEDCYGTLPKEVRAK